MLIDDAIGPFPQGRLNEALGLAIGLRPIGSREAMAETQLAAGGGEVLGTKGRAVVGEEAPNLDAETSKIGHALSQEGDGATLAFIRFHLGKADARMIIDGHKQELPSGPVNAVARISGDSVAHAHDPAELLGVDMQQITGVGMLVA